jgi:hypothetical protein
MSYRALLASFLMGGLPAVAAAAPEREVDVVVMLVVDQLPANGPHIGLLLDKLDAWGGDRVTRLDGVYPYATTVTCVGHTTLATGVLPSVHGVISNRWFTGLGEPAATECLGRGQEIDAAVPTLAKWVRDANGEAWGVSLKERSAVPLGGDRDHAVWWLERDEKDGRVAGTPVSPSSALLDIAERHAVAGYLRSWTSPSRGAPADQSAQDQGVAVDPADLPFVFEPFFRGRTGAAATTEGTGLGLSLCRRIVELHGGSVALEPRAGGGMRARVVLPAS